LKQAQRLAKHIEPEAVPVNVKQRPQLTRMAG